ncbi:MAG: hypothetical protein GT601_14425, partial [Acidaminobacter sp.]|uniref:helix-turn-helix domain-containing protein n=1 Tax=Acidaminobacter sp. TaxID=1872102 RepID=UPI001384471A
SETKEVSHSVPGHPTATMAEVVEKAERQAIFEALEASGGNREQAARLLEVSLRTLYYKIQKYQLQSEEIIHTN